MQPFALFWLASFTGWVYEFAIDGKINWNLRLRIPFLFVYGLGALVHRWLYPHVQRLPVVGRFIVYFLMFTVLEWLIGKLSVWWHGYRTWEYAPGWQISVKASIVWGLMGLALEWFY